MHDGGETKRAVGASSDELGELHWAEARLRLAIEAARLGPWEWDIASGKVFWSPSLESIHGIAAGSFQGTFDAWKRDIHPDDLDRVLAAVGEGLERKTGHNMEYRIVRPDGTVRWLEVRSRIHCDAEGRPVRMLGVCMDVTERKQTDEARELFIGILGHDLKNPLHAIATAAQVMLRQDEVAPAVLRAAAVVSRSAERMDRIISDLLDFARGRFGQGIPVLKQRVSMHVLCERVIDELTVAHPQSEISIEVRGDVAGSWDPDRVAQVASNLIANAVAHGGGVARVELQGGRDEVLMQVRNGGVPIPREQLPCLFQPFYSRSGSRENLGLGLFIASEVVKAHDGRIGVESSEGEGTCFTVHWPKATSAR